MTAETALRARVAELEEEVAQLRTLLTPSPFAARRPFGLTYSENKVLLAILAASPSIAKFRSIHVAVYGRQARDGNVIGVHVLRIRKKVAPFGVTIACIKGEGGGYFIDAEGAAILRRLMDS